jgi:hypothetical protein
MDMQPDLTGLFPDATMESPTMNELTPTWVEGELRIRDADLGKRLGYPDPTRIRRLIEKHQESLKKISILPWEDEIRDGAGRPSKAYYLNRKQAIYIIAKSEMPTAIEITIEIIVRVDAYERRVEAPPPDQPVLTPDDRSAVGGIIKRVVASRIRPLFQIKEMLKHGVAAIKAASVRGAANHHATAGTSDPRSAR